MSAMRTLASALLLLAVVAAHSLHGVPTKRIAPGVHLPMVGLGTWQYNVSRTETAVTNALDLGYVAFDTAHDYSNQVGVGAALKKSGKARGSYFVTTKVEGGLSFEDTISTHKTNLQELGLEYVDLLLIHFPTTMAPPIVGNTSARQAQWKAMEQLQKTGLTRSIGVSHFCQKQMEDILEIATIKPAINQVEYHVGMGSAAGNATDDKPFMERHGITFQSFSPLCGPCSAPDNKVLLTGAMVTAIGARLGKSGAQVALRWQIQSGIPVCPKTDNIEHLKQNLDLFNWKLSAADMTQLTEAKSPMAAGGGGDGTSGDCGLP